MKKYQHLLGWVRLLWMYLFLFSFFGLLYAEKADQKTKKGKVVYIDLGLDEKSLQELPFFTGLTIEETLEKPSVDFYVERRNPPSHPISLESDVRKLLLNPRRENIPLKIKKN